MARLKDRPDVEFFACLAAVARLADHRLELAAPDGLSLAGLGVLGRLALGEDVAPLALSRALGVSKAAMTHTLQRLESRGLVAVSEDPDDGRRKQVRLTSAGLAAQRAAQIALRPRLDALRAAFEPAAFEAALPFLRRLRAWLEADG
jgi:DNA-binding MarR family transcriptional regulator